MESKVTPAQIRKAQDAADRAALAVERQQLKAGYARSNDRTRELRNKAQALSGKVFYLRAEYARQQSA